MFPRIAIDPSIADRYVADIICPSHITHDPDCGICALAQITQTTPLRHSANHDAKGISKMPAESGSVPVLNTRPTVSPAGGTASDFGKSPPNPFAWVTWSRQVKAHYVSAEGQHMNRPSPHSPWEAWASASASAAEPAQEIERSPTIGKPQPCQPPLSLGATRHLSPPAGIPPKGPFGSNYQQQAFRPNKHPTTELHS